LRHLESPDHFHFSCTFFLFSPQLFWHLFHFSASILLFSLFPVHSGLHPDGRPFPLKFPPDVFCAPFRPSRWDFLCQLLPFSVIGLSHLFRFLDRSVHSVFSLTIYFSFFLIIYLFLPLRFPFECAFEADASTVFFSIFRGSARSFTSKRTLRTSFLFRSMRSFSPFYLFRLWFTNSLPPVFPHPTFMFLCVLI